MNDPPLTSSNEVDVQLYALLSIVLREYVDPWYTQFTNDEAFVDEVKQIVAHCTRAIEQRLRNVDLELLLLDEIPELIDAHLKGITAHAFIQENHELTGYSMEYISTLHLLSDISTTNIPLPSLPPRT